MRDPQVENEMCEITLISQTLLKSGTLESMPLGAPQVQKARHLTKRRQVVRLIT